MLPMDWRYFAKNQQYRHRKRKADWEVGVMVQLFVRLALISIVLEIASSPASCQEHFHLNTPPILIIPDRNWRISENEPVGQIIARIRADDSENDELIFGLESQYKGAKVPFRIDPIGGVVYLNQSLAGRGGENFFLYITVSDGLLTAKNEVYVNVLSAKDDTNRVTRPPPSISNVIHNISMFWPSFDRLPGVQSIRNHEPNRRPSKLTPEFNNNKYPTLNYKPYQQFPRWPANEATDSNNGNDNNYSIVLENDETTTMTTPTPLHTVTNRTILIVTMQSVTATALPQASTTTALAIEGNTELSTDVPSNSGATKELYGFRSQIVLSVLVACGIFVAGSVAVGVIYRKRLCAFSKNLKKKSKEEMARTSNQSNFSSINLTDDSRNSMVLNQWNGPMAYNNRYVPWERDQQQQDQPQQQESHPAVTSQFSTNAANTGVGNGIPAVVLLGSPISSDGCVCGPNSTNQHDKFDQWEFPRHRLKFFNILGEGAFGQVWRAEATDIDRNDGIATVAVKTLKENATELEKKDLLSELEILQVSEIVRLYRT